MIVFLTPLALAGLATLAVPIVVHLFKPRRVRVIPFTSLRWLKSSQHRLSRRIRWHQILLFLLRAAILILLALAAAGPVLLRRGGDRTLQRFVIVDTGRAMRLQEHAAPAPMEVARSLTVRLLDTAMPGRPATAIIAGPTPYAAGPLTEVPGRYSKTLRTLKAENAEAPVTSALRLVPPLRRDHQPPDRIALDFITANLAAEWNQSDISDFLRQVDVPVRVRVFDTTPRAPRNAWIASAEIVESGGAVSRVLRARLSAVGDKALPRTVRVSGIPGTPEATRQVVLRHGETLTETFEIPGTADLENRVAEISIEPPDALPDDDRSWLPLQPRGRMAVLLLAPSPTQVRERSPDFHLRTALEVLAKSQPNRFRLSSRAPGKLLPDEVKRSDLIFLVDPREISEAVAEALRKRVSEGAGLMIFAGPATDVALFNRLLFDPLQPSAGLVVRKAGEIEHPGAEGRRVRLSNVQWNHPLLAPFMDPAYGDLSLAGFRAYRNWSPSEAPEREQVLAAFPDGAPALVETRYGTGRVLLLNSTANDAWSDFPRRKGFLPFVDGAATYLAGALAQTDWRTGKPHRIPVPPEADPDSLQLRAPGGESVPFTLRRRGNVVFLRIDPVTTPGVYTLSYKTVHGEERHEPRVAQTGRAFSPMTRIDEEILRAWWAPAELSVVSPDLEPPTNNVAASPERLLSWLLILALLAFLAETVMSSRLCPRVKPAIVSDSVVYRRGFFVRREDAGAPPSKPPGEQPS